MQIDEGLDQELPVEPDTKPKSRKVLLFWLHVITFVLGAGLLFGVIWYVGYKTIIDALRQVGWGFAIVIGLNLLRHFMRAGSMYLAVPRERRTFSYLNALSARFGGEAVTFLTFTGPFLGDATKAVLLRKQIPLTHGASAVLIDNILYYVSVALMMIGGVLALVYLYGSHSQTMTNVLIGIVAASILVLIALVIAIAYQIKPLSKVLTWVDKRGWMPKRLDKIREGILGVETNVFEFYRNRTRDFFLLFFISCLVHFVSVTEVYVSLRLLGYESFWSTSFIIESLTKVVNVVFGFIPGTIGVYEGGNGVILFSLGYPTAVGVALALVRRAAILFSLFVGLAILLWRILGRGTKTLADDKA
jgi:uncharacterized protein (TIRG00374 family)